MLGEINVEVVTVTRRYVNHIETAVSLTQEGMHKFEYRRTDDLRVTAKNLRGDLGLTISGSIPPHSCYHVPHDT